MLHLLRTEDISLEVTTVSVKDDLNKTKLKINNCTHHIIDVTLE